MIDGAVTMLMREWESRRSESCRALFVVSPPSGVWNVDDVAAGLYSESGHYCVGVDVLPIDLADSEQGIALTAPEGGGGDAGFLWQLATDSLTSG